MRMAMDSVSERASDLVVEAVHDSRAAVSDEAHLARLARLEAHRGAGGDVEAEAPRLVALEAERRVGLEEMVMRAHLDRPVASIGDLKLDGRTARVQFDLARLGDDFAGDHGACSSADRLVDGDELGAVGEGRLDLDVVDHLGHAFHHLLALQHAGTVAHQLRHRATAQRTASARWPRKRASSTPFTTLAPPRQAPFSASERANGKCPDASAAT